MSTMVVYQTILSKEDDQEVLVCRLSGYEGDLYIQEAYCSNPTCTCDELYLSFYSLEETIPRDLLFGFRMNIEQFNILDLEGHQAGLDHEALADEFIKNIDVFKETLTRHYQKIKTYFKTHISLNKHPLLFEKMKRNETIPFREVIEGDEPITFKYQLKQYLVEDHYDMKQPKDVLLVFHKMDREMSGFSIYLDLKSLNYQLKTGSVNLDLIKHFLSQASIMKILKKRDIKMKEIGLQIIDSQTGSNRNKVEKVGRNEPCPCGSGKKYKHCCQNK